mmetsp:Transcript_135732/g.434204  ORF Transcript_135732/g.434204 Transcript_135732/m.434204 type:complete len:220 (+) Transcript_135732:759-1418(+)
MSPPTASRSPSNLIVDGAECIGQVCALTRPALHSSLSCALHSLGHAALWWSTSLCCGNMSRPTQSKSPSKLSVAGCGDGMSRPSHSKSPPNLSVAEAQGEAQVCALLQSSPCPLPALRDAMAKSVALHSRSDPNKARSNCRKVASSGASSAAACAQEMPEMSLVFSRALRDPARGLIARVSSNSSGMMGNGPRVAATCCMKPERLEDMAGKIAQTRQIQ